MTTRATTQSSMCRSLNLRGRYLTLAQKKEVAQKIFEQELWRSHNSIAKEAGLSPKTVTKH